VYGENDTPINCYKNKGPDRLSSPGSFQTPVVAPGEVLDRYRNANASQGFGYTLFVVATLMDMAEVMKNAGFDAFDYRGAHHQSIESAIDYYACYGKHPGFKKTVSDDNAHECPNHQQYIGQIVSGVEIAVVMGAYHYSGDSTITSLEDAAKAEAGRDLLDPIHFGYWRN
jgi:hypothetical protein